jgi:hypothetical protein
MQQDNLDPTTRTDDEDEGAGTGAGASAADTGSDLATDARPAEEDTVVDDREIGGEGGEALSGIEGTGY